MKQRILLVLLLVPVACWAQGSYTLPLAKADIELSLPAMAARGSVLYEAHRSFNLLRFSSRLQVSAFDLTTRRELRHAAIDVPRVHGARAADGFFLSPDGQELVYAEIHEPDLLLVLSAKDLSEVRRTTDLPFASGDSYRLFAGFDGSGLLSFASARAGKLRFVRANPSDFKITSGVTGPKQLNAEPIVWSPERRTTWVQMPSGDWQEYREDGSASGRVLSSDKLIDTGAVVVGGIGLVAFSGNMLAKGAVASNLGRRTGHLELACVPRPYSSGEAGEYIGAICTTSPDLLPERGGLKILTSEFLLLNAQGPTVVWRRPMDRLDVADSNDMDTGRQWGNPLLHRLGSKLLIVAPSKSPNLTVYEVPLPNDGQVTSASK
jgi:hypothetical protein